MIQRKVCMLGAYAVGKTSMVRRYVHSIFSEQYLTTVGVKIDKRVVSHADQQITLLLWDLYGEDEFQRMQVSYLRGSGGLLLVADGTRPATLEKALELKAKAESTIGNVPYLLILNKYDLLPQWEIHPQRIEELAGQGLRIRKVSAKTGEGVKEAFAQLTSLMMEQKG